MNLALPQIGGECQDFTRWWNSEGQFLQPIGDMQSEYGLDFAKKIAESVYINITDFNDAIREQLEAEIKIAQDKLETFIDNMENAAENENDLTVQNRVYELIEKYK